MSSIDLSSVNAIVTRDLVKERINTEKKYLLTGYSKMILEMEEPFIINDEWSREIPLQESLDILYDFFNSIDSNLANQFNNIIHGTCDNIPLIKFNYVEGDKVLNSVVTKYGVIINYSNNPDDIFTIAHEVLHFMNLHLFYDDNDYITETRSRYIFGEANSILGELLLKDYLITNHLITTNDFKKRYKVRINNAKKCAKSFIIEKLLMEVRQSGMDITYEHLLDKLATLDTESIDYQVFEEELNTFDYMNKIIKHNHCNSNIAKKYIYGLVIANKIYESDNRHQEFINFNNAICNTNNTVDDIYTDLRLRFPHI
ncbi:MAG: hypothetical protein J5892_03505 [Bacilli bacterium]|nr:hypothetical protein [Bacilli bacterium]